MVQRKQEKRAHFLKETEITGRKGCAKAFPGKVSEERWRQREGCVPRHKGTKESAAFWELEQPFRSPGKLGVCGEDSQTGLGRCA